MKNKLLLLHGALGSKGDMAPLKVALSKQFDCHDLNFEGHGGRPSKGPFSIAAFTENVVDYLRNASIDNTYVFGYSMGGYVALNTAIEYPGLIRQIITLGTKFDWSLESAQEEVKRLNPEIIQEKVPHFAKKLQETHHPNDWSEVLHKTGEMMIQLGKSSKLSAVDLAKITIPVTLGIGSKDRMVSIEESQWAADYLQQSQLVYLEEVRHELDRVDTGVLRSFIETHLL
jgi:pimeloyl-ACP methyl ester carboxylesterase